VTWVYVTPLWVVCVAFIGGSGALAALSLMFVRRRFARREQKQNNDFAGPVLATLGTILAVMLSFMVVTVWQQYDQSAGIVQTEADQISDLYHEVGVFPQPLRDVVRRSIQRYVAIVVGQEWPLMRLGEFSPQAHRAAADVERLIQNYEPTTIAEQNAQADALHHTHGFMDARGDRLFQNRRSVPLLLWIMMFFVAAVTLGSSYFFYVPDARAHIVMTAALAAVIGAIFVVIAELDLPFRGDLQIPPTAFGHDYATFADDPVPSVPVDPR
jgi:hypothetical protein